MRSLLATAAMLAMASTALSHYDAVQRRGLSALEQYAALVARDAYADAYADPEEDSPYSYLNTRDAEAEADENEEFLTSLFARVGPAEHAAMALKNHLTAESTFQQQGQQHKADHDAAKARYDLNHQRALNPDMGWRRREQAWANVDAETVRMAEAKQKGREAMNARLGLGKR